MGHMATGSMYYNSVEARTAGTMPVYTPKTDSAAATSAGAGESGSTSSSPSHKTDKSDFSFWDFLDIVNPLHHLPVVGALYRHVTGDEIKPFARVAGGGLYGGGVGAAVSLVDAALQQNTGKDMGATVIAMLDGDDAVPTSPQQPSDTALTLAQNKTGGGGEFASYSAKNIRWHTISAEEEQRLAALSGFQPDTSQQTQNKRAIEEPLNTRTEVLPSSTPTPHRTLVAEDTVPAAHSSSYLPVQPGKESETAITADRPRAVGSDQMAESRLEGLAESSQFLQLQRAPAKRGGGPATQPSPESPAFMTLHDMETPVPVTQDMIAKKMMEALEKYGSMKRLQGM